MGVGVYMKVLSIILIYANHSIIKSGTGAYMEMGAYSRKYGITIFCCLWLRNVLEHRRDDVLGVYMSLLRKQGHVVSKTSLCIATVSYGKGSAVVERCLVSGGCELAVEVRARLAIRVLWSALADCPYRSGTFTYIRSKVGA